MLLRCVAAQSGWILLKHDSAVEGLLTHDGAIAGQETNNGVRVAFFGIGLYIKD
jgi:hypothetical protein